MKKESITKLLWWALGIKTLYCCFIILGISLQNVIKPFFGMQVAEDTFLIPIDSVLSAFVSEVLMLVLALVLNKELKQEKSCSIGTEIAGVVLFCGISVVAGFVGNVLVTRGISTFAGVTALANYATIKSYLSILEIFSRVSSALFILACGMSIAYKKVTNVK